MKRLEPAAPIVQIRFSLVKPYILAASRDDGTISIYDCSQEPEEALKFTFTDHQSGPCTGITFTPLNHLLLCSCGQDGTINFYDIVDGKKIKTIST